MLVLGLGLDSRVPALWMFDRILAVPASLASVSRVFSKSGLIVRPHRAKISDTLLESLVFAKCSLCILIL